MVRLSFRFTLGVLFLCAMLIAASPALSAQQDLPVPSGAVKRIEKSADLGPSKSFIRSYETPLSAERIKAFYKKEMARLGWQEKRDGFFSKGDEIAIISIVPVKKGSNRTTFSIVTSRIPSKEEVLSQRKEVADKLDFMPVYPGSAQNFLWDTPTGLSASYETQAKITDVIFFYKSGMLRYGWRLHSEVPISVQQADCPECAEAFKQAGISAPPAAAAAVAATKITSAKAKLVFTRRDAESCRIDIYESQAALPGLTPEEMRAAGAAAPMPARTTILVTYHANRKITK
ncbi:MAG: hypothetical protein FJZ12_02245 [Candidatus Omnitrophica bacterium]|nr:hypothetical protein [Candidatus Omnitrophota bacterium]